MRNARWLERLTAASLLLWMLASVVVLVVSIVHSYSRLPAMDYWETIAHLDGYRHFPPVVLWEQHYEHRVIMAELVFAFDWLFLRGAEILPLVLNAVLDVGVWMIFAAVLRRSEKNLATWSALFLAGAVMFWPGVAVVLAFPFLLQWIIYQFCATAAFAALAHRRVYPAIGFAIGATYSSANGLFVWPVLIFIALALPLPRRKLLQLVAAAVVASSLFFVGYHNLGNSHPAFIWLYPAKFFGYFLSFLGLPIGAEGMFTDLVAGAMSLLLVLTLAVLIWRWKLFRQPDVLLLSAVVLITLMTAFVTSLSRIPIDRKLADAIVTPGRYVNTGAHYWGTLVLLTYAVTSSRSAKYAQALIGSAAVIVAIALAQSGPWIHFWMNQYALYQFAVVAAESKVDLKAAGEELNYADGTLATRNLPELERRHLSLYRSPEYQLLGKPFLKPMKSVEVPSSQIAWVQEVPGGFRIAGWSRPVIQRLAVVDGSGVVIGFGAHPGAGFPLGMQSPPGHEPDQFLACAGPSFRAETAHFYSLP